MKKILLCNDEQQMREVLEELLLLDFGASIEFIHVNGGVEAIEKYSRDVSLIIYDHHRSVACGEQMLNHNCEKENHPFLFLAGGGTPRDFHEKVKSVNSRNKVLSKPFCVDELSVLVKELLD